jgi:hypothetical protein
VVNTAASGPGSLAAAVAAADLDTNAGTADVVFHIPTSTAPNVDVPVSGFDPTTQTWHIDVTSQLPAITRPTSIDGYSEANVGLFYNYPDQVSSTVQTLTISGTPTGGTFTLTTAAPLPSAISAALPFDATASEVQAALSAIIGAGDVAVTGGPLPANPLTLTFQGTDTDLDIPTLYPASSLTGGSGASIDVETTTVGGIAAGTPTEFASVTNTTAALDGNDAQVRIVLDGSGTTGLTGLIVNASNSEIRGVAIEGFAIGISIPSAADAGDLIQGNFIGPYLAYPVDPTTGVALPSPNTVELIGTGNTQGIVLVSANATIGGVETQDANVIDDNIEQGVLLEPGASGNQILNNQIGIVGPSSSGVYFDAGNGDGGIDIESSGTPGNPASIVYSSSNVIGGAAADAGNLISRNTGYGVVIDGIGATGNIVAANFIGVGPGGGYAFGNGDPGNTEGGILINNAPENQVGGPAASDENVISFNQGDGVDVFGSSAVGNSIEFNDIGLTLDGVSALGNAQAGVDDTAPGTIIGPSNVISANYVGVLIAGASATGVIVQGNLIGTDSTGTADLGNAKQGVEINGASRVIVEGNGAGSQVISGNLVGVEIDGPVSSDNVIQGNFIGTDKTGSQPLGNSNQGVLIEGSASNTIGGLGGTARNLISANQWGVQVDGAGATGNLIEDNFIGSDTTGSLPLGNEINGILVSGGASNNTIGGTAAGQGNTVAFNDEQGIDVAAGTGNSILSNSIFSNADQGIVLAAVVSTPTITGVAGGGTGSNIEGSITSAITATFLIQFFSNLTPDPAGYYEGQTFLGSTTVATVGGTATINFNLPSGVVVGTVVTATATNESTGVTSPFSGGCAAEAVSVAFATSSFTYNATAGVATIEVERTGDLTVAVSVNFATSNGTAVAGQDYTASAGVLTFPVNATNESFTVPLLDNKDQSSSFTTVNLSLSQPVGGATLGAISAATLIIISDTSITGGGKVFVVTNTSDSGQGSLRAAIIAANDVTGPGTVSISFDIPASTVSNLNVPVSGFDPGTQTWEITLASPLPPITRPVDIDGYTEGNVGVPYRYPDQVSSAVQTLTFTGVPTGGSFTLTTTAPLPAGTTPPIPYSATAAQVQAALNSLIPAGDVTVSGGPLPSTLLTFTFQGAYAGLAIPNLIVTSSLYGGTFQSIDVGTTTVGGVALSAPILISTVPNATAALDGNNAQVRIVLNGSQTSGAAGLVLNASDSQIRGLAIEDFAIGISIPNATNVGDLIQGNAIGRYLAYPVDPNTGTPLPAPYTVELAGVGNTQGIVLASANTTIGGTDAQDANVIGGNTEQGVLFEPGASGNQLLGNQIGVIGPSSSGLYFDARNGTDGVEVDASSDMIGGATGGAGNLISDNGSYGVEIDGVGATGNIVAANFIGVAPGGGYTFGDGDPGNLGGGVLINNAPDNEVGGSAASDGNVISFNSGDGVDVFGASAIGNTIANNVIGLTSAGSAALGNDQDGVNDTAPESVIGPGNVISANLAGVVISGAGATGVIIQGNLIGTDSSGTAGLGNAQDGVMIDGASGVIVEGNGQGSQVISGNLIGVEIEGSGSSGNLIEGNFIGTDKSGTADRGNAEQGVFIDGGSANTIGGTTAAARDVISANQWGVEVDGATATDNVIDGSFIGTDVTGTLLLGNEINGIIFSGGASNNTVGGTVAGAGNTIAFNTEQGVNVQAGTGDAVLSNEIYSNDLGIALNGATKANDLIAPPTLITAIPNSTTMVTNVQGTYSGLANTTYLIQFFNNQAPDSAGYYEGQIFLGATMVTTGATGSANFAVNLATVVPAGDVITATATSLATVVPGVNEGDTSEFSAGVPAQPVSVEFETSQYVANSSAGIATIYVVRTGNENAVVSVNFATSNGTGSAGRDYDATSGTLTFPAGQLTETFTVTLLDDPNATGSARTVNLALSKPGGGATLGTISTAVLTINESASSSSSSGGSSPGNTTPPVITGEQLELSGHSIVGITLSFSQAMNPDRAQDLSNYGYYLIAAGPSGVFGSNADSYASLVSATYNALTQSVTLTPSAPLPPNEFYRITIDGLASPLLHNGLTDLAGNQLAGSNGAPGTPEVVTFGVGGKLVYTDSGRNVVTLQLGKGGVIEMFRAPDGDPETLSLIGTVPGKSTLAGTVKRTPGSTGRTKLPAISGAAGTRIKLKSPPFEFASAEAAERSARTRDVPVDDAVVHVGRALFAGRSWHCRLGARAQAHRTGQ